MPDWRGFQRAVLEGPEPGAYAEAIHSPAT